MSFLTTTTVSRPGVSLTVRRGDAVSSDTFATTRKQCEAMYTGERPKSERLERKKKNNGLTRRAMFVSKAMAQTVQTAKSTLIWICGRTRLQRLTITVLFHGQCVSGAFILAKSNRVWVHGLKCTRHRLHSVNL